MPETLETRDLEHPKEPQLVNFYSGQHDKDWTQKTPLEAFLQEKSNKEEWLRQLVTGYHNSEISLSEILKEIPESTGWVWNVLPQLKAFSGTDCLLFLGFCPQYAETTPNGGIATLTHQKNTPFTEVFLSAVARALKTNVINLCVRKDCRKTQNKGKTAYGDCLPVSAMEAVWLLFATILETSIAQKEFGIKFTGCFAFSTAAQDNSEFLHLDNTIKIMDPSMLGRTLNRGLQLVSLGLRHTVDKLSSVDQTDPKELFRKISEDIISVRPKMAYLRFYDEDPEETYLSEARIRRKFRMKLAMGETGLVMAPNNKHSSTTDVSSELDELPSGFRTPSDQAKSSVQRDQLPQPLPKVDDQTQQFERFSCESQGTEEETTFVQGLIPEKIQILQATATNSTAKHAPSGNKIMPPLGPGKYTERKDRTARQTTMNPRHTMAETLEAMSAKKRKALFLADGVVETCECGDCQSVPRSTWDGKRLCPSCYSFAKRNNGKFHPHPGMGECQCKGCPSLLSEDREQRQVFVSWWEPHQRYYCSRCRAWYSKAPTDSPRAADTHKHRGALGPRGKAKDNVST